jgi:hypothetical protein
MAVTQATTLADFTSGIGTAGAVLQVDNADQRVGIGTTDPQATLQVGIAITMDGTAGVITATKFVGEGSQLTGVSGLGTALSNDTTNVLSKVFFVNQTLDITSETTVTAPDSASQSEAGFNVAYTNFQDVNVSDSIDLIIADGSDLVLDVLQLR